MFHTALKRLDDTQLLVNHPFPFSARLFANTEVSLERAAVDELLRFLDTAHTVQLLSDTAGIQQVAVTPDFHKGAGIPVGTVMQSQGFLLPQAVGNDIGCGMRLHTTSLTSSELMPHLPKLEGLLRAIFFEGKRNIPLTGSQREAVLREGIGGLLNSVSGNQQDGLLSLFHRGTAEDTLRIENLGSLPVTRLTDVDDWLGEPDRVSRDAQIGSLGGGNHFVEVQTVHRILNPQIAYAWGLREGQVTVMVHSGSLGFGHLCGDQARRAARRHYPESLKLPANGLYPLIVTDETQPELRAAQDALNAAGNFAFVNRLFLALMTRAALESCLGELHFPLLYDAPHNFIWQGTPDSTGATTWTHRKGATPARGFETMQGTPFATTGEPVLVPGSMGASSFILAGLGLPDALSSASHGSGRIRARGDAMRGHEAEFDAFLKAFRIVTPVDLTRARRDIRERKLAELKQEAPFAYKGIGPVVHTLEDSGIAQPVVELRPLLTVKG